MMPSQTATQSLIQTAAASFTLLWQLGRLGLSAMVALSALTGYLYAAGSWSPAALLLGLSIGLLAAGCSALNQWQEQDLDARMARTCDRPLPAGKMAPTSALAIATGCIGSGLLALLLFPGFKAALLGVLAVIWYNFIYTPLKRQTAFAALPGAICGALPPMIGWAAAGGGIFDAKILILSGTLFLWQIPHSWLLLCYYRNDLRNSGLPDLFSRIPTQQLLKINNCWLMALAVCYLLFPVFGFIVHPLLASTFIVLLVAVGLVTLYYSRNRSTLQLFHLTNISMALLLLVILLDNCAI